MFQIHHQTRQEVGGRSTLVWCVVAICCLEMYSLFKTDPNKVGLFLVSDKEVEMFLYSRQKISFMAWVDYAAKIMSVCILLDIIRNNVREHKTQIDIVFYASAGYLIDYFLFYNNPFMYIGIFPVSYTIFMLFLLFLTLATTLRKWKL